tara:strand:- start:190 stop:876 length:687 start_codon:yes stop_codon:yes gene_type:complete
LSIKADHFIKTVKKKYTLNTNKAVAEHFGVTRSRISQWLKSNKIPLKYINSEAQTISDSEEKAKFYEIIIKKQVDHIELLEKELNEWKSKPKIFYKEVADNWQYDVKLITKFSSLNELEPIEIITVKTTVKNRKYYLGYTKEEFEYHFNNWATSPLFIQEEVYSISRSHEKRRIIAIRNAMDSFTLSNKIQMRKKNGGLVWAIYRTYYSLNENIAVTKIQILDSLTKG